MSLESIFKLSVMVNMVDNLTRPMSRINDTFDKSTQKIAATAQKYGDLTKAGLGMATAGGTILKNELDLIKSSFGTQKALGELSSLGIKDLKSLEKASTTFTKTWSGTSKAEFLTAAYDIKSGIASLSDVGVAEYTELSGMTAKATKSTISEMTSLFATGYGIYKDYYADLSDLEFGQMFSGGISATVQAFKTNGSQMAAAISTLGGTATSSNVPLEEQLAVLGMLQATMGGSESATKYRAFLNTAAKGGEELGLSFVDANNQLLSLPQILTTLKGKFGDTIDAAEKMDIKKAFGSDEAVALIDLLYGKTGDLQGNIVNLYGLMGEGTAQTKQMADAINKTSPSQYELTLQKVQALKEQLATGLLPALGGVLDKVSVGIEQFSTWAAENEGLVTGLLIFIGVLGGLLVVGGGAMATVGGLGLASSGIKHILKIGAQTIKGFGSSIDTMRIAAMYGKDGMAKLFTVLATKAKLGALGLKTFGMGVLAAGKAAFTTAITQIPVLISSVWGFTTALWACPITWIVVAVLALIAVIVLLYLNWDTVTAFLGSAWQTACEWIDSGIQWIKDGFNGLVSWIGGLGTTLFESGKKVVTTITDGIMSVVKNPAGAIQSAFGFVRNLLPFSDAKEGPLSTLTLSGQRILETVTTGIEKSEDAPAKAVARSFKKVSLAGDKEDMGGGGGQGRGGKRGIYIDKLTMNIDISKIKSLDDLLQLLADLEHIVQQDPEPQEA